MRLRTLEMICKSRSEGFQKYIAGEVYCGIRITDEHVICQYRAKEPDNNGFYPCLEPEANMLMKDKTYFEVKPHELKRQ